MLDSTTKTANQMTFKDLTKRADQTIFEVFGEPGTYNGAQISLVLDEGIEREDAYGEVYTPDYEITTNNAEVSPKAGGIFTVAGIDYTVVARTADDGNLTTCACRK